MGGTANVGGSPTLRPPPLAPPFPELSGDTWEGFDLKKTSRAEGDAPKSHRQVLSEGTQGCCNSAWHGSAEEDEEIPAPR